LKRGNTQDNWEQKKGPPALVSQKKTKVLVIRGGDFRRKVGVPHREKKSKRTNYGSTSQSPLIDHPTSGFTGRPRRMGVQEKYLTPVKIP